MASGIDYAQLLDPRGAASVYGESARQVEHAYDDGRGLQVRYGMGEGALVQDVIRLSGEAFLLASAASALPPLFQKHSQAIGDRDWIHIQVRLEGSGVERLSGGAVFEVPERSCCITRYPAHSQVERSAVGVGRLKLGCLWLRPGAAARLLDLSSDCVPDQFKRLFEEESGMPQHVVLPLQPASGSALNDVTSCRLAGGMRRAYMHAKSLELLVNVLAQLSNLAPAAQSVRLSGRDRARMAQVERYMAQNIDSTLSLADLARRFGFNRTKLAMGFRSEYGKPLQEYWRDLRLAHAREALECEGIQVSEAALQAGYSEISSFTRAFQKRFGILPRDCKSANASPMVPAALR